MAPDPGYRMLFDGTRASLARWAQAGPGRFELQGDCTLRTAGGLGLLWYDDEPFDSPLTLKVDWMIPGDANSGVFVGFPAIGDDPFVAVNQGYEIQIDPTDPAFVDGRDLRLPGRRPRTARPGAPATGRVEHLRDHGRRAADRRAPERGRRQPLRLDERSAPEPRPRLRRPPEPQRRRSRLVPQRPGQGVGRRAAALRGRGARAPSDAFSGSRLDGCRWNRVVRYDGGALHVSGWVVAPRAHRRHPRPQQHGPANLVLQRAPAGAWTIETTVRVPLRSGSQQAGLIAYRDDGDYVKLVAAAAGGRVRFRLVSGAGNAVARSLPSTL